MTMDREYGLRELRELPDDVALEVDGKVYSKQSMLDQLAQEMTSARLDVIAQRDDWVRYRASLGVEDRWERSAALYKGEDTVDTQFIETLKTGPAPQRHKTNQVNRSRVVVNIVRPKVDQAIARMCEILLPTDDRNWGIKPTPVPEHISKMLGNNEVTVLKGSITPQNPQGTPNPDGVTADQEAQEYVAEAKDKAMRMESRIDDQLTECQYNAEQRQAITDGVKLGTGIMIGPFPARQSSKVWTNGKLELNSQTVPASIHADPWNVWFDPAAGNNHQNGAGFWHRKPVTRKQIRACKGVLGFDDDAIERVLNQMPSRVSVAKSRVQRNQVAREQAYEMWTYHGELEPSQCTLMTQNTNGEDGPLKDVDFGVVILINDEIVGVMPSWIPDKSLPCDVWTWRESDESPYGHSLGEELEHQQRVITAAWRQVMDNARFAVGGQIVFHEGLTPADGGADNTIYPGRMWRVDPSKIPDVTKAMTSVDFQSHLSDLLAIADKAMEFADAESSLPQIIGGEQGTATETLGGMVMLYNNAQAVLRLRVKLYDDKMTRPHISRYYDWNMANSQDESIKGDMEVDARGSTALLERDIQNQATLNMANITSNPRYQPFLDPKEELTTLLKAMKIQPESVMASEDQIKKNLEAAAQAQPQDPRIVAAQIKADVDKMKIADQDKVRQLQLQQLEYNKAREQGEREIAMTEAQLERDITLLKLETDTALSEEQARAKNNLELLKIDTDRQLFNAEMAVKVRQGSGI